MSYWSKKFVLNDLYECWKFSKYIFNLINWVLILIKGLLNFNPKKSFIELEAKDYLNNEILMRKKCKWW
jgi:hypothetical protein